LDFRTANLARIESGQTRFEKNHFAAII